MMLKYTEPRMSIIEFDIKSIIVTSGTDSSGLLDGGLDDGKSDSIGSENLF